MAPSQEKGVSDSIALSVREVSYRYRDQVAIEDLSLDVERGEIYGLLGPNGGGKTTLFKLLSTLLPMQVGSIHVQGFDVRTSTWEVRRRIGVVFQHPSLDKKLSVRENLTHHARLYGLDRADYVQRIDQSLALVGLSDRSDHRVETLSGGLARRTEIAKALLHQPTMLILDEPSTGLDPAARSDLWRYLETLPARGVTVLTTTHLMEEAERCGRVAILDRGRRVALGTPDALRAEIGAEIVSIRSRQPEEIQAALEARLGRPIERVGRQLRFEHQGGYEVLGQILQGVADRMESVSIARPTLEDVFLRRTGHRFWGEEEHV
jgi:ABC-2 type transport system ATP-binding protein